MPVPLALDPAQMQQAAALYRSGKSLRQVAAALPASEKAVRTALRVLGVQTRPSPIPPRTKAIQADRLSIPRVASVFHLAQHIA